jgi:hypothetical protein
MKADIQFGRPQEINQAEYLVPFSIVGGTRVSAVDLIKASQKPGGGLREIEQKTLAELSALLQVELYGRVLSDEGEKPKRSNQPQRNSEKSKTSGGVDNSDKQNAAGGDKRPTLRGKDSPTTVETQEKAEETTK